MTPEELAQLAKTANVDVDEMRKRLAEAEKEFARKAEAAAINKAWLDRTYTL